MASFSPVVPYAVIAGSILAATLLAFYSMVLSGPREHRPYTWRPVAGAAAILILSAFAWNPIVALILGLADLMVIVTALWAAWMAFSISR